MKPKTDDTPLKQDSLDSIVTLLADVGETELLRARAILAVGRALPSRQSSLLLSAGYDTDYSACYGGKGI